MARFERIQLAVDAPGPAVRVVRVFDDLDWITAPRLARLVVTQMQSLLHPRRRGAPSHVVVDLEGVRSFGIGAPEILLRLRDPAEHVELHLSGLAPHVTALPLGVVGVMEEFSTFPTLEDALRTLLHPVADRTSTPSD